MILDPKIKHKKPAIALITYARSDYFEKVFNSIINQKINGKSFLEFFDFYVFQDGLLNDDTKENIGGHQFIKSICLNTTINCTYVSQNTNLCVALHFDYIERFFFEKENRHWAAFFEDDLILSPGYLETLLCLAESFENDDRVSMFNCFGMSAQETVEVQEANQIALARMDHHWGFGMYQSAWRKRQALVDKYLKIIEKMPYRKRNHTRINNWLTFLGFKPRATSQDYIKACSISAQGMIKVSSFANFGTYIGVSGLHFNSKIFLSFGYDKNHIFTKPITQKFTLDDDTYLTILAYQQEKTLIDPENFNISDFIKKLAYEYIAHPVTDPAFTDISSISEADVISGYKIFLGRIPESEQVIQHWVGRSGIDFFKGIIASREFRSRTEFYPVLLTLVKHIKST